MKDIQAIITKRAEDRLNKDIITFINSIKDNPLFQAIKETKIAFPENGTDWKIELNTFLSIYDQQFGYDVIYSYFHNKYIEEESAEFMLKVDQIKEDIDSLLNQ